jgi:acyl-CoA synthetase (AMP-forming)/AMP-acid ligase II
MGVTAELAVPLAAGATVVTAPRFEEDAFVAALLRHRVTFLVVPPPVARVLARHPGADALCSLELVGFGGAPLPASLEEAVVRRLPGAVVGQGWGMTELTGAASVPRRLAPARSGSVGRLLPCTELRVVDPASGADLPSGETGELLVRGPQVMRGYHDRPDATAELIDGDGWLHTGDLGRVDDGWVFVVDRLKELIKVNAHGVAPAELEALLLEHPAVADAAVVGQADEKCGEVPVAYVVPRSELDGEELRRWVADRVAPYKRLEDVRVVDALPRTPSGKLLRRSLREKPDDGGRG